MISCCVKGCRSECFKGCNISFHRFPKDENLKLKWIAAVSRGGKINRKAPVVCSRHFEKGDYKAHPSTTKQPKLKDDAVPTLLLTASDNSKERISGVFDSAAVESGDYFEVECGETSDVEDVKPLLACRGCLAVSRPLRPLERTTAALYGELVGTAVSVSDMYPKFLCLYCRALLLKFKAFKEMCRASQNTFLDMHSAGTSINSALLESGVAGAPYPKLETTHVTIISLQPKIQHKPDTKSNIMEPQGMNDLSRLGMSIKQSSAGHPSLCIDKTSNAHPESISPLSDIYNETEDIKSKEIEKIIKRESLHTKEMLDDTSNDQNCDKLSQTSPSAREIKMDHDYLEYSKAETSIDNDEDVIFDTMSVNSDLDEDDKLISTSHTLPKKNRNKSVRICKRNVLKLISKRNKLLLNHYKAKEKRFNVKRIELSKEEQLKQVEERKNSLNYKNSRYRCDLCYHVFQTDDTLKKHMEKHDRSLGKYFCEICHKWFRTGKQLGNHRSSIHKYNFICNECGVVNKTWTGAATHHKWHQGVKYACKICGKCFNKPTSVFSHTHLNHEATEKCPICDQKCFGKKGLISHMLRSHKEALGAVCPDCNTQFHNESALQRHRSVGCDVTRSPCVVCGEGFTTGQLLEEHNRKYHTESYTCAQCSKLFDDRVKYKRHCINHHHYARYRSERKRQSQYSTDKRRDYKCTVKRLSVTDNHICDICGITVKGTRATLQYHYRAKHTNERPYHCDYCQKRFALKHLLKMHVIGHMNKIQGNIRCRYCDQTFTLAKNRDRHVNTVHKKLTHFECPVCAKSFNVKFTMDSHIKHTHQGIPWPKRINRARGRKQQGNASLVRQETSRMESDPSGNGEEQSFEGELSGNDLDIMYVEEVPFYE